MRSPESENERLRWLRPVHHEAALNLQGGVMSFTGWRFSAPFTMAKRR